MNALSGRESAIVTELPGTTRDPLRERIQIDGMPLHLIDTAGLRESQDRIEQEGMRRARQQIEQADRILWIRDQAEPPGLQDEEETRLPPGIPVTRIWNKIDLTGRPAALRDGVRGPEIELSARTGAGVELLTEHLKDSMGFRSAQQGEFIARRRHLDALARSLGHLRTGYRVLADSASGELLAEDLRQAQNALSEITGAYGPDDLLGEIFSTFCIGK